MLKSKLKEKKDWRRLENSKKNRSYLQKRWKKSYCKSKNKRNRGNWKSRELQKKEKKQIGENLS